jgi:hypothetical protein
MDSVQITGMDNYRKPRQAFADKIAAMDDKVFVHHTETIIWLSAFANNNSKSDYHWQADTCSDEAKRRGKPELYTTAWQQAKDSAG